ncbi:MAG: c-type cytochrome [Aurantibacter sp.]
MGNKVLSLLLFFCFTLLFSYWSVQENTTPRIKIISPSENTELEWNTVVPYRITIVDQEDGNSDYDEININEVVLTVTYFDDPSKVKKYVQEEVESRSDMLSLMASSNCFTCHKAKDRLIGPSFEEIVNRYSPTSKNKTYLAKKINQGSKGVWSDEIMPSQPELKTDQIMKMIDWIFENAQDSSYTFYTGTDGAFKTVKSSADHTEKAVYVLHAQYSDHGLNGSFGTSKKGMHTIVLTVE